MKVVKVIGDINSGDTREKLVNIAVKTFGKIDILVNSAGLCTPTNLETLTEEQYDIHLNTNLKSTVFLTQLCLPYLIAQKGIESFKRTFIDEQLFNVY